MMRKISWTCIIAAIVALSGCAEGSDDTSSTIPGLTNCTNGTKTCGSNSAYQVCTDGVWGSLIPCDDGETCANGVCSDGTAACVENERQCTTASAYKICVSGNWSSNIECGANQICRSGNCVDDKSQSSGVSCLIGFKGCSSDGRLQVCGDDGYLVTKDCPSGLTCANGECIDPNASENKCDPSEAATCSNANTRKYCNANGAYVTEPCANGCTNGECTSVSIQDPECSGSEAVCADNKPLKTCSNGKYVTSDCPSGLTCANGECIDPNATSPLPNVGDSCDVGSFKNVCTHDTLYYCKSSTNTITSSDCSGSTVTCAEMTDGDDCVYQTDQCQNEGDLLFFSSGDCDNGILYYISCEKGTNGTLYGVLNVAYSVCDGNYRIYCASDSDKDSSYESCASCTYNASSYSATCSGSGSGSTTPEGSSTHHVGESCTSSEQYTTGCDGNTLVYCDGSKFVSYMDCSKTSGFYCDEQSDYNFADCVESCSSEAENYVVDFDSTCNSSGEFEFYVCEKGDSGNLGTFGGYYATSFCDGTTDYYCSGSSQLSKSCTTCEVNYNSTAYVYEATCK